MKMNHDFNERTFERGKNNAELPVKQTAKYIQSRGKAIELIESEKYGICDGDFWILMNETKNGTMLYTGLIISHNACLKINDRLETKFRPECVSIDKDGYWDSLVFTYCCPEQGMYEVGEVSTTNCKNSYPYAMAFKRLFDRVVLKLSRLAYEGVYSESEADEFKKDYSRYDNETAAKPQENAKKQHPATVSVSNKVPAEEKPVKATFSADQTNIMMYAAQQCGTDGKGLKALYTQMIADGKLANRKISELDDNELTNAMNEIIKAFGKAAV